MGFDKAINALKAGKRVTRKGWNGKGQYVVIAKMEACIDINGREYLDPAHEDIGSKFLMFVGNKGYQCGWLASQSDMLAEDWEVIE